jgi:hypothetical protein
MELVVLPGHFHSREGSQQVMNPNRLAMAVIKQRQALTAQPSAGPSTAPGLLIDAPDLRLRVSSSRGGARKCVIVQILLAVRS